MIHGERPKENPRSSLRSGLLRQVRADTRHSFLFEAGIGILCALAATAVRFAIPLNSQQLPTLGVVVALAIVTTFVGVRAGIATAVTGGLLAWYFFFNPYSWSLANGAWVPLVGFVVIAAVIITTSHLYRTAERLSHARELEQVRAQAANSEMFAREMAHRLKNALTIVQAISFQTLGTATEDTSKFAGRLQALSAANDLLNEHVDRPSASLNDVVASALGPFGHPGVRFAVECPDIVLPAQQVVSVALALHELATNAVKYGALSDRKGQVSLRFEDAGDRILLSWTEQDGPPVAQPERLGFGTRLLNRFGIDTRLDYQPQGLRCTMAIARH